MPIITDGKKTTLLPARWPLGKLDDNALEVACVAWHDYGLFPGQWTWEQLKENKDHRLVEWREKVHAAIEAYNASLKTRT